MKIYYVSFFDFHDAEIAREYFPATVNKMAYVYQALQGICAETEIVSVSLPLGMNFYYSGGTVIKQGVKVHFLPFCLLFSHHRLKDRWRSLCFFLYGLFHFSSEDVVISYHSPSLTSRALVLLRKIKKLKVILEVEEIYADLLTKFASVQLRRETNAFENCDGYIFSTELLSEKINKKNLPSVIIYGTYQKDTQPRIVNDDMIHVVYAGTFDPRKGCAAAAEAAAYLPKNYMIHICGTGGAEEIKLIKSVIDNLKEEGHNVCYEGLLKGQGYLDLLHRCQIGLSPQDPNAKFNSTSFPSKVLSYMSAGLAVVSINIPAIADSKVGQYITFYDVQTPEEIAKSIMNCDVSQGERNKEVIASLDVEFQRDIRQCIQKVLSDAN